MTQTTGAGITLEQEQSSPAKLDIVVPITSLASAKAAFAAATRLGTGLDSTIRLLKIQVVPFPLQLHESPVADGFLEAQLRELDLEAWDTPVHREIRYTREFDLGLRSTISKRSLVVLASPRRLWRTREQRLADALTRDGYSVVLVPTTDPGTPGLVGQPFLAAGRLSRRS